MYFGIAFGILGAIAAGFVLILGGPTSWLLPIAAVIGGLWLAPSLGFTLVTALRLLDPPALELALPQVLTLTPSLIRVVPRQGTTYETNWGFVCAYRVRASRIVLILSRNPHLQLNIAGDALQPTTRELLLRWLEAEHVPKDA